MKRNSFRVEREFGLVVGGILALLSFWWLYRGKLLNVTHLTFPIAGVLILLGVLYPRALVLPNRAWMLLGTALSFVSTRIILAILFFIVLTPIGLIKRAMGWDPLRRRTPQRDTYWQPYSERQKDRRHYEKMF